MQSWENNIKLLYKQDVQVWTGFNWPMGPCKNGNEPLGFIKGMKFDKLSKYYLLYSMELVCMVDLGRGKFGIWRDINSLGK
jgi:hypothetical protein